MECKYESSVREIAYAQELVYNNLSDLNNLERLKGKIPEGKVQDFAFDSDSMTVSVSPIGNLTLRIVERDAPKCIKFEAEQSPVPFNFWIQLLPVSEQVCKMKLTIKADLNPFIKGMVGGKLSEALEKMADILSAIPYE